MSNTLTANEIIDTLNGFEEIAISQKFGTDIDDLLTTRQSMGLRALAFTVFAREDAKSAYKRAMTMTVKELAAFFPDEPEESMPEEPVTDAGKDGSDSD